MIWSHDHKYVALILYRGIAETINNHASLSRVSGVTRIAAEWRIYTVENCTSIGSDNDVLDLLQDSFTHKTASFQ